MKRIFTFFLALLMIASALPLASLQVYATELDETVPEEILPAQSTETPQPDTLVQEEALIQATPMTTSSPALSGTCGENITWTLDYAGTLIISGTGAMTGSSSGRSIWHDRRGDITKVIVQSGVTQIASYSFAGCYNLVDAVLEDGIIRINSDAFSSCTSLKNVSLPSTLEYIGSDCFIYCTSLEEICIPDKVTEIQLRTFSNCTSLVSVTLPANLTKIGKKAFQLCSKLASIAFPEGLKEIGDYAFNSCDSLETVWIPLSLKRDGEASLATCPLKDIYYPGSSKQFRSVIIDRLVPDFRETATFHFGIPDLITPEVRFANNPQTGLQELVWNPVTDAASYEIYRATTKKGPFTKVADVTDTAWRDPDATIGKTYYYQVKAIHEDPDRSSACSAAVTAKFVCAKPLVSVTNDSKGKPSISWNKVSGAKKYTVYRATSENGKYTKLGTTTKLSYTDSKAKSGNTYFYKVIANGSKSSYDSSYSNIVSCGVICGAPSVSVKIDSNTGKPSLSWKKVDGAVSYAIFRDGEPLTTVTGVSFKDETAAIDTQYSYQVQALGKTEDLNGQLSKAVSATSGIAKPAAKGSVDAVSGKPVLTWEAVEGAVKYEIYRSTSSSKSYKLVETVEGLTYTDESVSAGKTYYYKVKAIGAVSKSADASYVKLTGKCATPEISAETAQSGKPKISWEKVTGAKKYTVYRATSETGKYKKLGTTTKLSYTDSKASTGATYFYKIVANASSSKNNSPYSNIVSINVRLAAPKVTYYHTDTSNGNPMIRWDKVSSATGYRILRKLPGEAEFKVVKELNDVYFLDADAPLGVECTYTMQAIGQTPELDSICTAEMVILSTIGKPVLTCYTKKDGTPYLYWGRTDDADYHELYVSTISATEGYTLLTTTTNLNYTHTDAVVGTIYYYKLVAVNNNGLRVESNVDKLYANCPQAKPIAKRNNVTGKLSVAWEAVEGAVKGYEIYRSVNSGSFKKVKTTKSLTYTDTSVTPGNSYRYRVRALGATKDFNGDWGNSEYVVATCAQPKMSVKLSKSGDPVVSWKKVSGAKQYIVMYVDVTDFADSDTGPSESYLEKNMQYVTTKKTSVTLKTPSNRLYLITMVAVPKNAEAFSAPSDVWYVVTE